MIATTRERDDRADQRDGIERTDARKSKTIEGATRRERAPINQAPRPTPINAIPLLRTSFKTSARRAENGADPHLARALRRAHAITP